LHCDSQNGPAFRHQNHRTDNLLCCAAADGADCAARLQRLSISVRENADCSFWLFQAFSICVGDITWDMALSSRAKKSLLGLGGLVYFAFFT